MWYCSNIPPDGSILPTFVVVLKRSSEGSLRAICSQSFFVCLSVGGNLYLDIVLSLGEPTLMGSTLVERRKFKNFAKMRIWMGMFTLIRSREHTLYVHANI